MITRFIRSAVLMAATFMFVAGASSVAKADMSIAIVDLQTVLSQSKAGKDIQAQIEKLRNDFQADVLKEEKTLRDTEQQLSQSAVKDDPEQIQKKADFEKKLMTAKQRVQDRRQNLEKAAVEAVNSLRTSAVEVITDLSKKKNYDVVLAKQAAIITKENIDITADVMKALNDKVSKIEVKAGGAAPAAAPTKAAPAKKQ